MFSFNVICHSDGSIFYSNIYATQDLKPDSKIEINVQQYTNTYESSGGIEFFFRAVP